MQTPQTPRSGSSAKGAGKSCWSLDPRVLVLLMTLAGVVILLLLYRLLQTRHRLRMASARNALEYYSFYHTATYTLKHPSSYQKLSAQNGKIPETTSPVQTVATTPLPSPPPVGRTTLLPPPPAPAHLPEPPLPRMPPRPTLPLPVIHTTPPSPQRSWGACSDVDVYSCIGAYRPSRLSGLSGHSKVILFEHSLL